MTDNVGVQALFLALSMVTLGDRPRSVEGLIADLRSGNSRFVSGQSHHGGQGIERRLEVAKGQAPFAIVLTCADSRVAPEILFDQGLGDLFVLRVAGNVADTFALASIEYAAEHLGAPILIVLGHERCGAVKAAVDSLAAGHNSAGHHGRAEGHIPALVAEIVPSVKAAKDRPGTLLDNAIAHNVARTIGKIQSKKPLSSMVNSGQLTVIGAVYDLDTGLVRVISQSSPTVGAAHVKVYK